VGISALKKVSQCEADIAAAIQYLGERNPRAALDFVIELDKKLDLIVRYPEWFPRQRRTSNPKFKDVRFAVIRPFSYLIFYTYREGTVTILRVQHGAMKEP
jgi:plasmid stabilization system protein ParE